MTPRLRPEIFGWMTLLGVLAIPILVTEGCSGHYESWADEDMESWVDDDEPLLIPGLGVLDSPCPSGWEWYDEIGQCGLVGPTCTACSAYGLCGNGCYEGGACSACPMCECGGVYPHCNPCPCPCGGTYPYCTACSCPCGGTYPNCKSCSGGSGGGSIVNDDEPPLNCTYSGPTAGSGTATTDCVALNVAGLRNVFNANDSLLYGTDAGEIDCSALVAKMLDGAYGSTAFSAEKCNSTSWKSPGYSQTGGADNLYNYIRGGTSQLGAVQTFTNVTISSFGLKAGDLVFWDYSAGTMTSKMMNHVAVILSSSELAHSRGKDGVAGSGPTIDNPSASWLQTMAQGGSVKVYVLRPTYCSVSGNNGSGTAEGG